MPREHQREMSVYLDFNNTGCINRQQMYNREKIYNFMQHLIKLKLLSVGSFNDSKSLARFKKGFYLYKWHAVSIPALETDWLQKIYYWKRYLGGNLGHDSIVSKVCGELLGWQDFRAAVPPWLHYNKCQE